MMIFRDKFEVTEAQYKQAVNLEARFKKQADEAYIEFGYGALMLVFNGLHIGIEKDGHAHS